MTAFFYFRINKGARMQWLKDAMADSPLEAGWHSEAQGRKGILFRWCESPDSRQQ